MDETDPRVVEMARILREKIDGETAIDLLAAHMVALDDAYGTVDSLRAIAEKLAHDYKSQCASTVEVAEVAMTCAQIGARSTEFHISAERKSKSRKKKAADVRHEENRAMKSDAFKWLDANFHTCKTISEACERISAEVVPAQFRTVQQWVTEWRKLRSPSSRV